MIFFRIALSLYGIEALFYTHVANGKAEKEFRWMTSIVFLQLTISNNFSTWRDYNKKRKNT